MKTTLGDIKIKLYDGTPLHRDNFIKLVNSSFYDGISFHRVIKDFMIQAGDSRTRSIPMENNCDSLNTYTLPSEFSTEYFHKKGALAAAREGNSTNPQMRSSGTQFYIVQGTRVTDQELNQFEQLINNNIKQSLFYRYIRQIGDSARDSGQPLSDNEIQEKASDRMYNFIISDKQFRFTDYQRSVYKSLGGVPRLDQSYTVFGEVIHGLEVIDMIASVPTGLNDTPLDDIKIIKARLVGK